VSFIDSGFTVYLLLFAVIAITTVNYTSSNGRLRETKSTSALREGYVLVPGGNVWYRVVGANRKKIPLLLLHGGPGASHDYLEPLEPLSDERPVIFYDQLGSGNSDRPDDRSLWTIKRFVEELEHVREALQLHEVHILGQSWGTMLGVDYVLAKAPQGVTSLILSGPCLSAARWSTDQKAYLSEFPEAIRRVIQDSEASGDFSSSGYQEAMKQYYKRHVCRLDPWPECLTRTFEKLGHAVYEYMWGPSEFTVTGLLKDYDRTARLKEISIPTLFTCGRYDEATPDTTTYYHTMLPGSEIAVLEGASHEHHIERPEQYMQIVRSFLHRAESV
jgi:proline iminopeptidase